ncbi:hypothetical protein C8R43DRAFT_1089316 [Mycena crocata]|nr:hypothetical protein C8R43DRAFT_1089316 [Mycena crocata]
MHTSQLYLFLVALLVTIVAADSLHDSHWSRKSHRAVARSKPAAAGAAPVARSVKKRRSSKGLGRRSCKAPSNSTAVVVGNSTESSSVAISQASSAAEATTTKKTSTEKTEETTTKKADSTKTATTEKSAATSNNSGGSGGGGVLSLKALFPAGTPGKSWTTSPKSSDALSLSDNTLNPTKLLKALAHPYDTAPDGKEAMKATYPKGSYTFTHSPQGGLSFYAPGPDSLDMTKAKTLTLGYSVFFEKGFDFNMGGKLPGLYGGNDPETAIGCSGGRRSTACYSVRLMWRTDGAGEIYSYLPDYTVDGFEANKRVCNVKPESDCNPTYGASVGRGAFHFPTGEWTTVSQRVKLNDVGKANGEMQLWVNGKSVIEVTGLIMRDSDAGRHRGIQVQTFFGGSGEEWASPKTQSSYFSDFSVAVLEEL